MEDSVFYETPEGVPQGGVISPTLANMALNGLEAALGEESLVVRYCDDFFILGKSKEALENRATHRIRSFLKPRGVKLNRDKTHVVSIDEEFDFLGSRFRGYPDRSRIKGTKQGIFLVKPAAANAKRIKRKVVSLLICHMK